MRQHIRHRHPEIMDETTKTERVKERSTEEETKMLAQREAELLVQQEREGRRININISLQVAFPRRTLESVKGHRRYVGLCMNASKAVSFLVKGGNDISRSLVSRKARNNVPLLGGRPDRLSSHGPCLLYGVVDCWRDLTS